MKCSTNATLLRTSQARDHKINRPPGIHALWFNHKIKLGGGVHSISDIFSYHVKYAKINLIYLYLPTCQNSLFRLPVPLIWYLYYLVQLSPAKFWWLKPVSCKVEKTLVQFSTHAACTLSGSHTESRTTQQKFRSNFFLQLLKATKTSLSSDLPDGLL